MCGIAGFIADKPIENRDQILVAMGDVISYRGPDEHGYYKDDNGLIGLAHRRLSIIDLSSGQQPMLSSTKKHVLIFNGEIYNFQSIRKELEKLGHSFRTSSDTEVLLASYLEWGTDCVEKFIGMFAFALLDLSKNLLFLARDRLGIKPLYYHHANNTLVFGSEVKSILASGFTGSKVDIPLIDFFISTGYVPGENTLFKGIKKVPPGHYGIYKDGKLTIKQYWTLESVEPFPGSYNEAAEHFHFLLNDSVKLRLISDVPVGVFLSGGVDSGAIVATASNILNKPVSTFSIGFTDVPEASELGNASQIAALYQTDHHPVHLTHGNFIDSLGTLLYHTEEPLVEAAAIALMLLSFEARKHAIVLLSGEGADEVFAGYPLYQLMNYTEKIRWLLPFQTNRFCAAFFSEKTNKYMDWLSLPLEKKYQGISNDVTLFIKKQLYHKDFYENSQVTSNYFHTMAHRYSNSSSLRKMQFVDFHSWLPDDLLLKADKMTMAASIELRVPFLDHRMVEFGFSLPDEYKIKKGIRKYLLKKEMEGKLPNHILYQKKKGFPIPIKEWFRGKLFNPVSEILLDQKTLKRGYFNSKYIHSILQKHKQGNEDLSRRILSLLVLELWHRQYID